jgi:uncharacterized membrane protein YfcA
MTYLLLAVIGLLGGIASGLFGVGGGLIFVPLLMLVRAFDPHVAIGTSLAIVVPTALVAMLKHASAGMVDWKVVPVIVVFAFVGAWLGASLSLQLDSQLLKRFYAGFLILVALKIFFTK